MIKRTVPWSNRKTSEARKCPRISKYWQNNYTTLISTKNTRTFVLTTLPYGHFFFLAPILIAIKINKNALSKKRPTSEVPKGPEKPKFWQNWHTQLLSTKNPSTFIKKTFSLSNFDFWSRSPHLSTVSKFLLKKMCTNF